MRSHQAIAEGIVRILTTSIALVATVPSTTGLAALVFDRGTEEDGRAQEQ